MLEAVRFQPGFSAVGRVQGHYPRELLSKEISVYASTPGFVREHGGPIANAVMDGIPEWYKEQANEKGLSLNIDMRVHDLKRGDYPASPGWHCDSALREIFFGQKSGERIPVEQNLVCSVSSSPEGVSNTEFLKEPYEALIVPSQDDFVVWQQIDKALGDPPVEKIHNTSDGEMVCFDTQTLHRVQAATTDGIRLFMRVSMWGRAQDGEGNIGKFEQVYRRVTIK